MDMTIRSGLFLVVAAFAVACGGASTDPLESVAGGQSRLDGKEDPSKPADSDCTKPGDPVDPNVGVCWWGGEGSDTSCKGADVWKQYASDACSLKGGTLTNLAFGESCQGGYRYAKYECCAPEPKDPAPVPPKDPAPGDPSSCIGEYANNACQSEAAWKDHAFQTCSKLGLALADIGYGSVCGKNGEIGEIKFSCCK